MNCPQDYVYNPDTGKCEQLQIYKPGTINGAEPLTPGGDQPGVPNPAGALKNVMSGIQPLIDALNTLTNPSTWVRVGIFMVALVFVIVGFWVIAG